MKTNTVEQAERLKELGVKSNGDYHWKDPYSNNFVISVNPKNGDHEGLDSHFQLVSFYEVGPALTLDDLHGVFIHLVSKGFISSTPFAVMTMLPYAGGQTMGSGICELTWVLCGDKFKMTDNHAQDWTEILIWIIEEGRVGFEVVNNYFKNKP